MAIPSVAANAYQTMARLGQQGQGLGGGEGAAGALTQTPDFGGMVRDAVSSVNDAGQKSEGMALGLVQGKADVVDVVTAIAETEVALETMVSVRDRVIAAYEEIMRMSI